MTALQYVAFNRAIVKSVGDQFKQRPRFSPTREQAEASALFATKRDLVIVAGAGTGKTSTLVLLRWDGDFDHAYANTMHSLAFRDIGKRFGDRLNSRARMSSENLAALLGIEPIGFTVMGQPRVLSPATLAGIAMNGVKRFCMSADREPGTKHVKYIDGIDEPRTDGERSYANNNAVARHVLGAMHEIWEDAHLDDDARRAGKFPFDHAYYLKMWELSGPLMKVGAVMFDEAQDASPVMKSIVGQQTHAQRVYVGDPNQAINEWMGAVDALEDLHDANHTMLTQSFRFGPSVAGVANGVLEMLPTDLRLRGFDQVESRIRKIRKPEQPEAVLTRSNAAGIRYLLDYEAQGVKAHLVGDHKDTLGFCKGAKDLQEGRLTDYPDLACFASWSAVEDYVKLDAQGDELRLMVNLVNQFGPGQIMRVIINMPDERAPNTVKISTAHKAKGREWDSVRLGRDFPEHDEENPPTVADLRLLYVAATRAKHVLDCGDVGLLADYMEEEPKEGEDDAKENE